MIAFTDTVIEAICDTIGSREPESGGALFGPQGTNLISEFVFDEEATTTSVLFVPSASLAKDAVKDIETDSELVFRGIIHSHPGLTTPSGQDRKAWAKTLRNNGHLPFLVVPIVTFNGYGDEAPNVLSPKHRMEINLYRAIRQSGDSPMQDVDIVPTDISVIPTAACMAAVKLLLDDRECTFDSGYRDINGVVHLRRSINWADRELDIYFSDRYPMTAPLVCFTRDGLSETDNAAWMEFEWGLGQDPVDGLASKLERHLSL